MISLVRTFNENGSGRERAGDYQLGSPMRSKSSANCQEIDSSDTRSSSGILEEVS